MKRMFAISMLVLLFLVLLTVQSGDCVAENQEFRVYRDDTSSNPWVELHEEEVANLWDIYDVLVEGMTEDQNLRWRWARTTSEWIVLPQGENKIERLVHETFNMDWDVLSIEVSDGEGSYKKIGDFPARMDSDGDFVIRPDQISIVSLGLRSMGAEIGLQVDYDSSVKITDASGETIVSIPYLSKGAKVTFDNLWQGMTRTIVGRKGTFRSLPWTYTITESDEK